MKKMCLSDSYKVIRARDVELMESREKTADGFIPGICRIPANEADSNACENNKDVEAEIEKIRKEEKQRIKIAEKDAYDSGFSKGLREGIDREKRELSFAAESAEKMIGELKMLKEELMKSSEKEIIGLAFLMAEKVIHKEVSADREVILSVLRDAIRDMRDKDGVRIRLNPEDYRYITEAKPDFLANLGDILIEKDEKIGRGGAVIETHLGAVDARLDQQLNNIRDRMS